VARTESIEDRMLDLIPIRFGLTVETRFAYFRGSRR